MGKNDKNSSWISRTGRRKNNEDIAICNIKKGSSGNRVLLAVADGMGGLEAGEFASGAVRERLEKLFQEGFSPDYNDTAKKVRTCIRKANHAIYDWSRKRNGMQMGTTVSGAVVINNKYLVFNVGDSRTYIIGDKSRIKDGIERISIDHSVDQESVDAGIIKENQVGKGAYSNALTRTVGTDPDVEVDIFPPGGFGTLHSGDILFACTDGLWNKIKNEDIRREMMGRDDTEMSLIALYNLSYNNGSKDNISMATYRHGRFTGVSSKSERPQLPSGEKSKKPFKLEWKKIRIAVLIALIVTLVIILVVTLNNFPDSQGTHKEINPAVKEPFVANQQVKEPPTSSITVFDSSKYQKQPDPPTPQSPNKGQTLTDDQTKATNSNPVNTRLVNREQPASNTPQVFQPNTGQPLVTTPVNNTQNTNIPPDTTPQPQINFANTVIPLNQLDINCRQAIEVKFNEIVVEVPGIKAVKRAGDYQVIIELTQTGMVKSVDIPGIEVEPKDKEAEVKSRFIQTIKNLNFSSPTIGEKPVNVSVKIFCNIWISLKKIKFEIRKGG